MRTIVIVLAIATIAAAQNIQITAIIKPYWNSSGGLGVIFLHQGGPGQLVIITGTIMGVASGTYGIYVHENTCYFGDPCQCIGSVYNPTGASRQDGYIGDFVANSQGQLPINANNSAIILAGVNSIWNLPIVIHSRMPQAFGYRWSCGVAMAATPPQHIPCCNTAGMSLLYKKILWLSGYFENCNFCGY